jgi:hypothetical protein
MFTPWNTVDVIKKFPSIKLAADISHWMCVLSNTMDAHMDLINAVAPHVYHIHGRVGYDNGPQVPDPRAPEWLQWVEAHERCWDIFWKRRAADGAEAIYFEPEYGMFHPSNRLQGRFCTDAKKIDCRACAVLSDLTMDETASCEYPRSC